MGLLSFLLPLGVYCYFTFIKINSLKINMMEYFNQTSCGAWTDKHVYDEAEALYYGGCKRQGNCISSSKDVTPLPATLGGDLTIVTKLVDENKALKELVSKLEKAMISVTERLDTVEAQLKATHISSPSKAPAPAAKPAVEEEDDDDDVDLFGSSDEEEDAEAARIREERLKAYAEKKSKKAGPIAKSSILLDVKPWDDETDLKEMEAEIKKITMDGLVWGAAKSQLMAFGISKLQILCTIEDEKVSVDDLQEKIEAMEEFVQSTDIAAFNKI